MSKKRNLDMSDMRAVRKKTLLNQSDFWKHVGVTQSGGSRYESGRDMPKPLVMLLQIHYEQKLGAWKPEEPIAPKPAKK